MLFNSWSSYSRFLDIQTSAAETTSKSKTKMDHHKNDTTVLTPFCFSGSKILMIKNPRIGWAGNVARMWENRMAQQGGLMGKPEGKNQTTEYKHRRGY